MTQLCCYQHSWDLDERPDYSSDPKVRELPLAVIRRPVARNNNLEKVSSQGGLCCGAMGPWAAASRAAAAAAVSALPDMS